MKSADEWLTNTERESSLPLFRLLRLFGRARSSCRQSFFATEKAEGATIGTWDPK